MTTIKTTEIIKSIAADVRVGDHIDFMRDRFTTVAHVEGQPVPSIPVEVLLGGLVESINETIIPEEEFEGIGTALAFRELTIRVRLCTGDRVEVVRKEHEIVYIKRAAEAAKETP